jgi:hypothetical protein
MSTFLCPEPSIAQPEPVDAKRLERLLPFGNARFD